MKKRILITLNFILLGMAFAKLAIAQQSAEWVLFVLGVVLTFRLDLLESKAKQG